MLKIPDLMNKIFTRRRILTAISLLPLAVFLKVARHYGLTEDAWMRAFLAGAALSAALMAVFAAIRVPLRDILLALGLLFISGAAAFLADLRPVLAVYERFQGSVFLVWYLLVRAVFYFAPELLSVFAFDPYERAPGLAAALTAGVFVWSLFHRDILVSTVLPMTLMMILLSLAGRAPSSEGG
ncbi:MAG: hypothetical protein Q7R35_04765 [Elusimicrobiota bacterium]|nr:hypothetical protein [Elusimicrobiota bacterium]